MRPTIIVVAVLTFCQAAVSARANDSRCAVPPYGMTVSSFKAFAQAFGGVVVPAKVLPALCNAKYGGTDRTGLYNLGFTDQDIDSKSMGDLAPQFMTALFNLADKTHQ
ncbi:MAG: hypothetical protein WDN02_17510 [Methylovirgula sp.]|uniref:hypothetical protein n=1 Tax=Methylovirgula sp. TaxID=1978224 RepID=UPI003076872F